MRARIWVVWPLALAGMFPRAWAAPSPPHLNAAGAAEYRAYLEAPDHRAFAIAPGGAWGWTSGEATAQAAEAAALATCRGQTGQRCVTHGLDGRTVFDTAGWPRLWGPYADGAAATRAGIGRTPGQRLPDLAFKDADGKPRRLSSFKGKVVLLHFWGAWCPPCRQEMPELQKLHAALAGRADVAFVLLQARERFDVSRRWAARQGIALPLHDSGSTGEEDDAFRLGGGRTVRDREIASRFPTTYVLDKRGLIVFTHIGPVHDWPQYENFLRDAAERSGR
jgi:peroxiredoxin